jgi:hypothetical protein
MVGDDHPVDKYAQIPGFGFHAMAPLTHEYLHFACFVYVDDTDTVHCPWDADATYEQVAADMQSALNLWEGGLIATGGALSVQKCWWHLISFRWCLRTLEWVYRPIAATLARLTIRGESAERQTIRRFETSEPVEGLGIEIAVDGNQDEIKKALAKSIAYWAGKIRTGQLTFTESALSLATGISKTIDYPLVATRLTQADCYELIHPLRQAAFGALHIPKTFSIASAHLPKRFLGLGIPDLWFEQGFAQVTSLLQFGSLSNQDLTGQLLRNEVEGLRLELGLPGSPFQYEYKLFAPSVTCSQLDVVWAFCSDAEIVLDDGHTLGEAQRINDVPLMKLFADGGCSAKQLRRLNLCRMYLRVIWVSDLVTGDGFSLDKALLALRTPFPNHSAYLWPKAGMPSNACWTEWSSTLRKFLIVDNRRQDFRLTHPLTSWTTIPTAWTHFYDLGQDCLFTRLSDDLFVKAVHFDLGPRTRHARYRRTEGDFQLPASARPTTASTRGIDWYHTGHQPYQRDTVPPPRNWWGRVLYIPEDLTPILQGIRNGTACVVTDGSYKDDIGTAAYKLVPTLDSLDGLVAVNQTPGSATTMDAYRAELGGLYGCFALVQFLCTKYGINAAVFMWRVTVIRFFTMFFGIASRHQKRPTSICLQLLAVFGPTRVFIGKHTVSMGIKTTTAPMSI